MMYQRLIDRGWRRSGHYCYKPDNARTCCPAYTIRLKAAAFAPSTGNKKTIKRVRKVLSSETNAGVEEGERLDAAEKDWEDVGDQGQIQFAALSPQLALAALPQLAQSMSVTMLEASPTSDKAGPVMSATASHPQNGPRKQKVPWVKQPKKPKNAPSDIIDLILESEKQLPANRLEVKLVRAALEEDTFNLYRKYQTIVHKDPPGKIKKESYKRFLVDSPITYVDPATVPHLDCPATSQSIIQSFPGFGTFHQKYYLNGNLVAVSVLDILPHCVSAVYFMYDPSTAQVRNMSLGVYSALRECAMTKQFSQVVGGLDSYYMGYYIHSCSKMRYKAQFRPSELLCPKLYTWVPVDKCIQLLDINKVARLSVMLERETTPDSTDSDVYGPDAISSSFEVKLPDDVINLKVFKDGRVTLVKMLSKEHAVKLAKGLIEFVKLVGVDVARDIFYVV
ncbi:arginine-tRNA-protein transferase [Chytriomyces sp. MP71]|nr:arginine-tRNA-protein transferase [Chytriomyces sp. MP71]